jgi:hypothetical protein
MNTKLLALAMTVMTLAGSTLAIGSPARDDEAQRLLRMKIDGPFAQGSTQSKSTFRINRDGQSLVIEQRGDLITMVSLNGESIPQERIRISDSGIEILDADKQTVLMKEQIQGLGSFKPAPAATPARRVMLGVTLEEIDETLREHLGLKEDIDYALVEDVTDDSPAAKAGLKPRDIIVAADGVADISSDDLRAKIRGKKAGEKLNLTVLRRGQRIDLTATLEEVAAVNDENQWGVPFGNPNWPGRNNDDREMRALTEELARRSEQAGKDAAEQARKLIEDLKRQGVIRGDDDTVVVPRPGQPMVFSTIDSQTKELEAKLKDMNDRLRRMEELLARLEGRVMPPAATPPGSPTPPASASPKNTP